MSELPEWPTKEQYEAAWKGRERDLTRYYQDAAFAAIPRLKLAVGALEYARKHMAAAAKDPVVAGGIHVRVFNALQAIGELPHE